jgi:hypothetical protein
MNWQQFEHIIRASAQITGLTDFVVIGSQAILAIHCDAPRSLRTSIELDLYPKEFPERSIEIDGAIGELSYFHETHGIYAHGVGPDTATLPQDWESRIIEKTIVLDQSKIKIFTPELHDLAFSKLAAGRPKDLEYVRELLRCELIGSGKLQALLKNETNPELLATLARSLSLVMKSNNTHSPEQPS